jgi:hypothetical protein
MVRIHYKLIPQRRRMAVTRTLGKRLRDIDFIIPGILEKAMLRSAAPSDKDKIKLPLVAIVGPPRVGSTLMYQLMTVRYQSFYFDNFQHALLRYPYLAFELSNRLIPKGAVTFESDHGFVKGFGGLSEGAFFWPFWFDMTLTQKDPKPSLSRLQHVRRVLNRIYTLTGKPMVNANNAHAFYLSELDRRFGKLVIVNIRRDPVANAVSLLRARRKLCSRPEEWWSMKPAHCATLEETDPYRQIICQIIETYRQIKKQRSLIPHVPIVDLYYEELCNSPVSVLDRIAEACYEASIELTPNNVKATLPKLTAKGPRGDEREDAEQFRVLFGTANWDDLWS